MWAISILTWALNEGGGAHTSMAVCRRFEHSMSSMRVPCTPLMFCWRTKRFTLAMPLAMSRGMLLSTCRV